MAIVDLGIVTGVLLDKTIEATLKSVGRLETVRRILHGLNFDLDELPTDFDGLYTYTLVEYGVGKPLPVLNLFREPLIKAAFRSAFEQQNRNVFDEELEHFLASDDGRNLYQVDYNPRQEFAEFEAIFTTLINRARTMVEVRQDQKLDNVHQDVQKVLSRLTQSQQPVEVSLLDQVTAAFNREIASLENSRWPNGVALLKLASIAVEEHGDFDAAHAAFMALLRLATANREKGYDSIGQQRGTPYLVTPHISTTPRITVAGAATKALKLFMQNDFMLCERAINQARLYSLIGDAPVSALSDYSAIPHKSFGTVSSILWHACYEANISNFEWAAQRIVNRFAKVLLGLGVVLVTQGFHLPKPPTMRYFSISGPRIIEPSQPTVLLPFVSLAGAVAELPAELYEHALTSLRYSVDTDAPTIDTEDFIELPDAIESIRRWAVIPETGIVLWSVKNQTDVEVCTRVISETNRIGRQVASEIQAFLVAERALALRST